MPIKVLYIHPVGAFGGASRSLMELVGAFQSSSVDSHIISPKGSAEPVLGMVTNNIKTLLGVFQFDNTRFGFYRGLRWAILLREIIYLPFFIICLLKVKRDWVGISLIHINEITAIFAGVLAKRIFQVPVILHVRSVQVEESKAPFRSRLIARLVNKYVDEVIAIDESVRSSLSSFAGVKVIHNGFRTDIDAYSHGARNKVGKSAKIKVAIVGGLLELKGIFDYLYAAKLCLDKKLDIEFIIVGENIRQLTGLRAYVLNKLGFYRDVRAECEAFIEQNRLQNNVKLVGFNFDVARVYKNIDILCFPSHLEAVGRPVFEAAFFKVPSIVAITNPLRDTFIDGETGLAVKPRSPEDLAQKIEYLYRNPQEVERMGDNAYRLAIENFDAKKNAQKVLDIYKAILSKCES